MKKSPLEKRAFLNWLKSSIKAPVRAAILASALLLSSSHAPAVNGSPTNKKSIRERVALIRETLKQKVTNNEVQIADLSFSEKALTQWGNWGNWGNWNNWNNWVNWNNWRNWGNWGNWGKF